MTPLFGKPGIPFDAEIPQSLADDPEFMDAWLLWNEYRKESRKKMVKTTARLHLKKLQDFGPQGAVASIMQSIERSWTGLFQCKDAPQPHQPGNDQAVDPNELRD